jgi:hypothetical protein
MARRFLTKQEIRDALVGRADEFGRLTGKSKSEIGKLAVNDGAALSRIEAGGNFTVDLYGRFMDWFDKHWPQRRVKARGASAA